MYRAIEGRVSLKTADADAKGGTVYDDGPCRG